VTRFILAFLNIKAILQEPTLHRRREKLDAMTNGLGLGDAYDATIGRIKAQEGNRATLGMATLMWISHSERLLEVDEICHALAVEIGSSDINTNNVPSTRTVLACCQGLATVDKESSTIRLIHFTLKEHLSRHADLFYRPHSVISETCLTFLNFKAIKDLPAFAYQDIRGPPLLEYSSLYWGIHMRMELSDRSRCLALNFLDQYKNHISAVLLWRHYDNNTNSCSNTLSRSARVKEFTSERPFSALHCVSYFGIVEVAIDLIRTKRWDINGDDTGLTPLMWAARCGREEVVKLLLQLKDTQPDILHWESGRTAFSWAAGRGHEGVVRLFLSQLYINPRSTGRQLGRARQVASALFGWKYFNPDEPDCHGETPLMWAAKGGHDGVVKLLLEQGDVSPDRSDNNGVTPLQWAAANGHDGVVKLLLEREDVSPDRPDNYGRTPFSRAAENGYDGVVKLLLEQEDVSPDRSDNYGRTPLWWAAWAGSDGVVKLLLDLEDVSPDRPDNDGRTPFSEAAQSGYDRVVKLLLELEDVSPDRSDNDGKTPLWWAASGGHDGVVKLLLEQEDVNPDRSDNYSQTPLWWAARLGHNGVVKLLLGREDVNPDRSDSDGRTPLSWAANNGHDGVVKLLLEREDVSPDKPDNDGRTPLSWAAANGRTRVVKLLLGREDGSANRPDNDGQTPLWWAVYTEHNGATQLLLGVEDVCSDESGSLF